jgi:cytochrome c oxidase subunit 3
MHEQDSGAHPAHLQHHFDTPVQQFDSAKLGMWLFLATEILLFGGLFCAYAVYRGNHPEIFIWSHHLLDRNLGAINTVILLSSSLTMAWAVRCSQLGQRKGLVLLLSLTILGGFGFMGIKYIEYTSKWKHGLLWGKNYKPDEHYIAEHFGLAAALADHEIEGVGAALGPGDPETGKPLFLGTCYTCHGVSGEGIIRQGASLRDSQFIADHTDEELLTFLQVGRQPFDPESTMKLLMPPRGGNPTLTDEKITHVIAYVRELQDTWVAAGGTIGVDEGAEAAVEVVDAGQVEDQPFLIQRSVIPPAATGPAGRALPAAVDPVVQPEPQNVQIFFSIYFLMTGLHGLHVLAGMGILTWLLVRATKGHFGPSYFTPVDLGGLYWHLVDLIWIFLFPLLYLIH